MATYIKNVVLANESNVTTEAGVSIVSVDSSWNATVNSKVETLVDLTTTGNTIIGNASSDTLVINSTVTWPVVFSGAVTSAVWVQNTAVDVIATVAWATTGIIPAGSSFVSVTSANSAHIVKLPTPVLWNIIYIKETTTAGFNVIPAATTQFINGTEVTGAKVLAAADGVWTLVFLCTVAGAAGKWVQYFIDDDGTIDAGATPA